MINPAHLETVLALASDHLRGVPLPPQDAKTMAAAWGHVAAVEERARYLKAAAEHDEATEDDAP